MSIAENAKQSLLTDQMTGNGPATDLSEMEESKHSSLGLWFLVFAIILVGLVFRAHLLDLLYLDFDESMHFQAARELTLSDAFQASQIHTHPPLIFLFYHYWINLGDSEVMLRLPALIFSVSALYFAFLWLRDLVGERPALVGLVFLTFSMPMIHLGAQVRGYTLLLTFMFAALYFHERFQSRQSLPALIGCGVCLGLAMLTHYTAAWLILVLGIISLIHVVSGAFSRRIVISWMVVQLVLLSLCIVLYYFHVRNFVNSETKTAMWDFWLQDSDYTLKNTAAWKIPLMRTLDFIKFTTGFMGLFAALCVVIGTIKLGVDTYRKSGSFRIAAERVLLIVLPLCVAMLLFQFRIYPLGHTRHSMWLIPFIALGLSASTLMLASFKRIWRDVIVSLILLFWVSNYAVPVTWGVETADTPENARQFVDLIKETVPKGQVILTDDSSRNVLEYYLVGREPIHGKPLGGGYVEYQMGNYRVVTIPKFHFYLYRFGRDWKNYVAALGPAASEPVWVVYFGYGLPEAKPENLYPLFPPGELSKQAHHLDNQILRIQFRSPLKKSDRRTEPTQQEKVSSENQKKRSKQTSIVK